MGEGQTVWRSFKAGFAEAWRNPLSEREKVLAIIVGGAAGIIAALDYLG
jgi:hypothetical protein